MVQSSMLETFFLKSGGGTGGGAVPRRYCLVREIFPRAVAVYATKGYSSCVSRLTRNAAMVQRFVKRTSGTRWHLDTPFPYS